MLRWYALHERNARLNNCICNRYKCSTQFISRKEKSVVPVVPFYFYNKRMKWHEMKSTNAKIKYNWITIWFNEIVSWISKRAFWCWFIFRWMSFTLSRLTSLQFTNKLNWSYLLEFLNSLNSLNLLRINLFFTGIEWIKWYFIWHRLFVVVQTI